MGCPATPAMNTGQDIGQHPHSTQHPHLHRVTSGPSGEPRAAIPPGLAMFTPRSERIQPRCPNTLQPPAPTCSPLVPTILGQGHSHAGDTTVLERATKSQSDITGGRNPFPSRDLGPKNKGGSRKAPQGAAPAPPDMTTPPSRTSISTPSQHLPFSLPLSIIPGYPSGPLCALSQCGLGSHPEAKSLPQCMGTVSVLSWLHS